MSDKMKWPMPAPRSGFAGWELWAASRLDKVYLISFSGEGVGEGDIELTQGVWDDLPEPVQEAFFKLAILTPISSLKGVGSADGGCWLALDSQLTPKKIANKTFREWYENLPRVKESDDVQQQNQ
jgi:hypothetical protein